MGLGIALLVVAALFQIFDHGTPQENKTVETAALETRKYTTLREILQAYVDLPDGLDFAACFYKDTIAHAMGNQQVARRLIHHRVHHDASQQLEYYLNLCKEVHALVKDADTSLKKLDQGILFRVVYDVEKGGLFYTQVSDGCYVISATIDQASMDNNTADLEMRSLVRTIEQHIAQLESH